MDLHAVLIALIALLCAYLLWLVIRWRRLSNRPVADSFSVPVDRDFTRFDTELEHQLDATLNAPTEPVGDPDVEVSLSSAARRAAPPMPRPAEPDASSFGFDALLEVRQMRHIIDELRNVQAASAEEVTQLREELARLRDELAGIRAASRVSPAYAEAVSLLQQGYDVDAVAERCGISMAEAQLVRSLSSQQDGADQN